MLSHSGLLLMTYLLIKATSTPAPMGSKIVGIAKATENHHGIGLVDTGVTLFQGCVAAFCASSNPVNNDAVLP